MAKPVSRPQRNGKFVALLDDSNSFQEFEKHSGVENNMQKGWRKNFVPNCLQKYDLGKFYTWPFEINIYSYIYLSASESLSVAAARKKLHKQKEFFNFFYKV